MNILVIGDSCDDVFVYGVIERMSPEAPVPVLQPTNKTSNGGMSKNVYNNLIALGVSSNLITNTEKIVKRRYVDDAHNQMVLRIDENDECEEIDEITRMHICNNQYQNKTYDAIVISDYCKGFLSKTDIELLCKSNKNVFVDTKKQLGKWIQHATFIKINSFEYKKNYDYFNNSEFINKLPNKFDTIIGENGIRLSGGEKQRLSIARAMLKKSKIILLDEATSSLDAETESKIQEAIKFLTKNRTTLVIAHRLSTIMNSNKIYVVDDGRIAAEGNHQELIKSSEIYKNFYEKQLRKD